MFIRKGGGSGATTLSALTDTSISSPSDGQILGFNGITGKWENKNPSGGSTISKKRYTITASSWSNSVDANGYYTYTIILSNPTLDTSYPPEVNLAGANDSTFYTDTEAIQYSYLAQCNLTASTTLVLYAKTKPDTTFYVFVTGLAAS